jgi:protoporphyrinogen oxidase
MSEWVLWKQINKCENAIQKTNFWNKFVYITNTIIYFPWKVQSQDKINDFSTESVLDTWLEEVFK